MTAMPRVIALALLAAMAGCEYSTPPESPEPEPPTLDARVRQAIGNWGVIPIGPMPQPDTALVRLGQALFFDPVLSGNRDIACATCHDPARAMTDGLSLAVGTGGAGHGLAREPGAGRQFVPRSSPTLLNQGLRAYQVFWDGRVSGFGAGPFETPVGAALPPGLPDIVSAQAMLPVLSRLEMRGNAGDLDRFGNANELAQFADNQYGAIWNAVMQRLVAIPGYVTLFGAAFPGTPPGNLTFRHAAIALAAFQSAALTRANTPFDQYLRRNDDALTTEQKRGALLFFEFDGARCASCHGGPLLGGQSFANVGVPQIGPGSGNAAPLDLGRGEFIAQDFYRFSFRVPPLRNVELTAPYFHDGAYPTLDAVVNHYNDVGLSLQNFDVNNLAPNLRAMHHGGAPVIQDLMASLDFQLRQPLNLTPAERADLVAFLRSLTDPSARDLSGVVPASVPSGLTLP